MKDKNVIDITNGLKTKEFIETHQERLFELENAMYKIMDCASLREAQEIAAEAVYEDLDEYQEEEKEDIQELDFNDDKKIIWDEIETEE